MIIRDADSTIWKNIDKPAVIYDVITEKVLHIGEYSDMEVIFYKKYDELMKQRKIQAANDMCLMRITSQFQLDEIWQTMKVRVLN